MISADAIRGSIDILILSQLLSGPSYAYAMAKTITEVADGAYTIKQTTLYSALKRLEASGDVEAFSAQSESGKPRTYYRLTPAGQGTLSAKCDQWEQTKLVVDRFVEGVR